MTSRNVRAALQVIHAQRGRTVLLAIPVAITTGLALATLVIDHGLTARAEAAARSFGSRSVVHASAHRSSIGRRCSRMLTSCCVGVMPSGERRAPAPSAAG